MINEIPSFTKAKELWQNDKPVFLQNAGLFIFAAALPFSVSLIQGGILLLIAAGLWRRHKAGSLSTITSEIRSNPLFIPWMIYLAAGAVAAVFGLYPMRSLNALNSDLFTALTFFGLCLFLEPAPRDKALNIYTIAITATAVWGICQALSGLADGINIRAHASNHPVRFGEIMVIGLALTLARLFTPDTLSARARKLLWTAALIIIAAIVLSQTRGAYLGTALVFAMLFVIRPQARKAAAIAAVIAVLLGMVCSFLNPTMRNRTLAIYRGASSTINSDVKVADVAINTRVILWHTGYKIIKDHPVLGVGPGNVKKVFTAYCPPPYPENQIWGSLHNLYIHQTAERGFIGLAALLTLFIAMFAVAVRRHKTTGGVFTAWAVAIMLPYYLMNVTEITFQHVNTSYAVLLALCVALTAKADNK